MTKKKDKQRREKKMRFSRPLTADNFTLSRLEKQLLQAFAGFPLEPVSLSQLCAKSPRLANYTPDQTGQALDRLCKLNLIEAKSNHRYRIVLIGELITGKLELYKDGTGKIFHEQLGCDITLTDLEDLNAFSGDLVLAQITEQHSDKLIGKVIQIEERLRTRFVGTIEMVGNHAFCIPQDNKIKPDFSIPPESLNGARHGDKVLVTLTRWHERRPEAEVIEIFGSTGTHKAEMHAIVCEFGIDETFGPMAIAESEAIPETISPEEIRRRRDFRSVPTFTIDPVDAKDFDDALSIEYLPNGHYQIGVHIADVTYYLKENTALDQEAFERATSVYLVDRTIPMLPEKLSNDLCSLKPHTDRLTFSAVFEMDDTGKIYHEWFGRTVIHSRRRYTYEEVQQILEGGDGDFKEELLIINKLATHLRTERFANGSIDFDMDETRFKLDDEGKPIAVYRKVRQDAHRLIEDFMLLANRRVAAFVAAKKYPFVYRIHPIPAQEKLVELNNFVRQFGYSLDLSSEESIAESLNRLVVACEGRPEQQLIRSVSIRSMPKAIYTVKNVGHYGLGFKYYAHFTSPIRRYPDVLVHRVLTRVLEGSSTKYSPDVLERFCRHCSNREKRASDAERASIKYKSVEFLTGLIGKTFDGTISGITEWGVYVELDDNKCEGMISIRDFTDDKYVIDSQNRFQLIGQRTRRVIRFGDRLRVRIRKTNLVKRIVDFDFIAYLNKEG